MRVVAHTCSNTEIVCALGCADFLVGVDADSDHPPEIVAPLPKLGRDLTLDVAQVRALKPDLVLSSHTLPGHEVLTAALDAAGLRTLICAPHSLEDVYADIQRIADVLEVSARGAALVKRMREQMPPLHPARRPRVHVEWWPKPVIAPARRSWVQDLITLAGGDNAYGDADTISVQVDAVRAQQAAPELIVMAWCGVPEKNYRAEVVARREGWQDLPAVRAQRIVPITEAWLGRPGPRLVEGYRALCSALQSIPGPQSRV